MSIVQQINCPHCGAPIDFKPGEILATCKYCGYTAVVETGQTFTFEHSMIMNRFDPQTVEEPIHGWMSYGFLKPADLAKKSRISEKELVYLPFWVVSIDVASTYKGVFERLTPAVVKDGKLEKQYDWLVLARKATEFPTREYEVPLEGKLPYDFRKIEGFAKVFNSEVDRAEAVEIAEQQIDEQHKFLLSEEVDKIIEFKSDYSVRQVVYLHSPVWFVNYEYRGKNYQLLVDGATGTAIKGDMPSTGF